MSEEVKDEMGWGSLDLAVAHALEHWCVPCGDRPDGVPTGEDPQVGCAIHDDNFKALYQLWSIWAREDGRNINDQVWAVHFASMVLAGMVMPIICWDGTLPVSTATMMLQHDPWDGKLVSYGDHAYTLEDYRHTGALYKTLAACHDFCILVDADKMVMPIAPQFDWDKYKPFYEAMTPGWELLSRVVVNHRR